MNRISEFDQAVMETLYDPETVAWGNELIDIVTAFRRGEITEFEAKLLVFEIRDVRAVTDNKLARAAVIHAANAALIACN